MGERRSSARVIFVSRDLLRRDFGIGFRGDRSSSLFERRDEIEKLEAELTFRPRARVVNVGRDRTICDFALAIDAEYLFFSHVLEEIAHAQDDNGMTD